MALNAKPQLWMSRQIRKKNGVAGSCAPSPEAVPKGKAPKMQVELLNPGETTKQYAVIFYQGDEAFSRTPRSLRSSTTLQVHISQRSERCVERRWDGSIPSAKCTRRFPSMASTK